MTTVTEPSRETSAYSYELPDERIARTPADPPDSARLLVLKGGSEPEPFVDARFRDLARIFEPGDVLAINETQVLRARLHGVRVPGGGAAELLLLEPAGGFGFDPKARDWHVLAKPGRQLQLGRRIRFGDDGEAQVTGVMEDGRREVHFDLAVDFETFLARHGELPLPPYVGEVRDETGHDPRGAHYQTIFARVPGSVAAPTASLHFTPALVDAIRARGVIIAPLVLDVGIGTFRPIAADTIDEHTMHSERYAIPESSARSINQAKREGRRVIAAGTTTLRALEASALAIATSGHHAGGTSNATVAAGSARASLFITPGFEFRAVDALVTNFHLPRSSLLVLVSAFAGHELAMRAYAHAIASDYRFYSFGDAMFVQRGAVRS